MPELLDRAHRRVFATVARAPLTLHATVLRRYFDWWHRRPDPWRYATDPAEQAKYATTIDRLPGGERCRLLEVGCSEGLLTTMIARRHPRWRILGVDVSRRAIARASAGTTAGNLRFEPFDLLTDVRPDTFDVVLCSEVLYYLGGGRRLAAASRALVQLLAPGGHLVVVHPWPESTRLHRWLDRDERVRRTAHHVDAEVARRYSVTTYRRAVA